MKKSKVALVMAICLTAILALSACGAPYSNYDLSEYIKVGKYKGLEVAKYEVNVTNKEVNKEIKTRLEAAATTEEVKVGTVKDGDTVVVTYEGKINGKTFDGGSASGANLTIGSGQFIDGFEEGLIGEKVGTTKKLNLQFPSDYSNEDLAGKKVVFTITIDAKQEKSTPKLDKNFVTKNSKSKTVAAYKESVKKDLEKKEKEEGVQTQKDYLWNKVVETSEVKTDKDGKAKYPEEEIDNAVEKTKDYYKQLAESYNLEYKDFVKQYLQTDTKTLNKQLKSYAKTTVKEEEVLYYIADKEDIKVSNKEYDAYITKTLKAQGYTKDSYKETNGKSFEDSYGKDTIMKQVYLEKVKDFILDKAKVVDKVED